MNSCLTAWKIYSSVCHGPNDWTYPGHAKAGADNLDKFLPTSHPDFSKVQWYIANHIKPIVIDMPDVSYKSVYQRESFLSQFRHWLSSKINGTNMWSFDDYRNSLIKSIEDSDYTQKIIYIDANEWNSQGFQDPRNLYMEDNIHLNFKGYTLLDSCIARHICMDIQ